MSTANRSVAAAVATLVSGTALGIFGLAFGTVLALIALLVLVAGGIVEFTATVTLVVGLLMTQGVGCFCTAIGYSRYRHRLTGLLERVVGERSWLATRPFRIPARVPTLKDLAYVAGAYVLAFGGVTVVGLLVSATGVEAANNAAAETGMQNPELLLLLIPGSILLIGPGEELLFRGVVQGRFREHFGPAVAIVSASLLFAAIHFTALQGAAGARLVTIGILVVPALVFGVVYELTDNIVVPALVHGLYNATLFGLLYLSTVVAPTMGA
ncbi:CPBP family intramembrane glutamic endopeptidase [Halobium salinum]|uniref:CPBP family intramembrane glutamic endopeptidase n=1 Tax=Halobium salinum TaxID=1364940 RepID=A0ABD5PHR3_9EURY|nr:CPBP family intramembrane glutamic endopeptidase [Halobium salinum]